MKTEGTSFLGNANDHSVLEMCPTPPKVSNAVRAPLVYLKGKNAVSRKNSKCISITVQEVLN